MIIYKTTNLINNKFYVGKDVHDNPNYLGSGLALNRAIEKYGKENFRKEVLERCDTLEQLACQEIHWIEKLNAITEGYNIANGGNGGNTRLGYTDEEMDDYKKKLSDGLLNSKSYRNHVVRRTGVARPNHSKILKQKYASGEMVPWNKGISPPDEVRKKISKANSGKKRTKETRLRIAKSKYKPVVQYTLGGDMLAEHISIKHASASTGVGRDSIYGCCIGKYKQGGGYLWSYADATS